jgi:hypothetical protein
VSHARTLRRRCVPAAVVALSALAGFVPAARAQAPSPAPSATPVDAASFRIPNRKPDVQVVILSLGPGQWAVSTTYPKVVPEAEARGRVKKLLTLTGWHTYGEPRFSNDSTSYKKLPLKGLSSVSFLTPDPVVDVTGGSLDVTPFVRAFADLDHINVTLFPPKDFPAYRGLRSYADKNLDVTLAEGQGSVTYVANIKNHTLDSLTLPRFQDPAAVSPAGDPAAAKDGGKGRGPLVLVLAAAVGAGLVAFAVARAILSRGR